MKSKGIYAASQVSNRAAALAPSILPRVASRTRQRTVSFPWNASQYERYRSSGSCWNVSVCIAQLEKSLLEDYPEDFFSQKFLRCVVGQIHGQGISGFNVRKLVGLRWGRELEQVQRAVDSIDGEESRLVFAAEIVVDTIEVEGDVDQRDALERAEAKSAE